MPVLRLQRRELYCQAIAAGISQGQAARSAGFSETNADAQASRLNRDKEIIARIAELRSKIASKFVKKQVAIEQTQEAVFVQSRISDRSYRIAVLEEMVMELREYCRIVDKDGNPNTATYREARECLKQAAIELGQWEERQAIEVSSDAALREVPLEKLIEARRVMLETRERLLAATPAAFEEPDSGLVAQ